MQEFLEQLVEQLSKLLTEKQIIITTAESCTGGLVSAALTHQAGASKYFDRGFITYSNEAKHEMLGVPENIIEGHGAVSAECAEAMAEGALKSSNAGIAISITGIAGPGGGTEEKPIGTVFFGYAVNNGTKGTLHKQFEGDRYEIQTQAKVTALKLAIEQLSH